MNSTDSPGITAAAQRAARPVTVPQGGLTSAEAAVRLARDGRNELPAARPVPLWRRVAAQVRDPLVLVLLAAAVLTIATGDWTDAGVIVLVIVVNTAVGVTQEVKAGQAIAALSQLTAPEARVAAGRRAAADPGRRGGGRGPAGAGRGRHRAGGRRGDRGAALLVDESALTGESVPVDKAAGDAGDGRGTWCRRARRSSAAGAGRW